MAFDAEAQSAEKSESNPQIYITTKATKNTKKSKELVTSILHFVFFVVKALRSPLRLCVKVALGSSGRLELY